MACLTSPPCLRHLVRLSLGPPRRPISILSVLPNLGGGGGNPPSPHSVEAQRQLPYGRDAVYDLIADVDGYSAFLPHCTQSRVTRWTAPDHTTGRRWPTRADLTIGWGPFSESYTSRLYCIPGQVVEAVSGKARPTISPEILAELGLRSQDDASGTGHQVDGIFESLVTRWTVRPAAGKEDADWSDVTLSVRFQLANPTLGLAVAQVADQKVEEMIQAFENQARKLYS